LLQAAASAAAELGVELTFVEDSSSSSFTTSSAVTSDYVLYSAVCNLVHRTKDHDLLFTVLSLIRRDPSFTADPNYFLYCKYDPPRRYCDKASAADKKVSFTEVLPALFHAKFDPNLQQRPRIEFKDFTLNEAEVDEAIKTAIQDEKKNSVYGVDLDKPDHVLSVKVLDDSRRNQGLLSPQQQQIPAELILQYHEVNDSGECNSKPFKVPDEVKFHGGDRFLEDIERIPVTEEFLSTLRKVDDTIRNEEIPRGVLKRGKKLKSKVSLDSNNIISSKRQRKRVVKIF
jgi:hypothetical protein